MNSFITTKQAAVLWEISEARLSAACSEGQIPNAVQVSGRWLIPADTDPHACLPESLFGQHVLWPTGLGVENYPAFSSRLRYVDKTRMVRELIDQGPGVFLFTKPRRFGKTLNLNMLRCFFERTEMDTSVYFMDKDIWDCGEAYRGHQGKYPVISLTFKDVAMDTWEKTRERLILRLRNEISRHQELKLSPNCAEEDRVTLSRLASGQASPEQYEDTLLLLSRMLSAHHGSPVVTLIDEFDTPITQSFPHGFQEDVISFLQTLFSRGLNNNDSLKFTVLAGILPGAGDLVLSGAPNLHTFSVLDSGFSACFGFAREEAAEMAAAYHVEDKLEEIQRWYGGYHFGGVEVFSPWSVVSYVDRHCSPEPYWINTSGQDVIGRIVEAADGETMEKVMALLNGEIVRSPINTGVILPEPQGSSVDDFGLLLAAGYLTAVRVRSLGNGLTLCDLAIPNLELAEEYAWAVIHRFCGANPLPAAEIRASLLRGDIPALKERLPKLLNEAVSHCDLPARGSVEGLIMLIRAVLSWFYTVTSQDSGNGPCDLALTPRIPSLPGIRIRFGQAEADGTEDEIQVFVEAMGEETRNGDQDAAPRSAYGGVSNGED